MNRDLIYGLIYGQALGDAVGAYTEFRKEEMIGREYPTIESFTFPPKVDTHFMKRNTQCDWTDDTDHLILLMEMLTETGNKIDEKLFAKKLSTWVEYGFQELGDMGGRGCGNFTARLVQNPMFLENPLKTSETEWALTGNASNGSLMRCGIMACRGLPRDQTIAESVAMSKCTHFDERCSKSVAIMTALLYDTMNTGVVRIKEVKLENLDIDGSHIGYVELCLNTGLWAYYEYTQKRTPFSRIIKRLALKGGDADTNCAVAGALIGACAGYQKLTEDPEVREWVSKLPNKEWLDKKIEAFLEVILLRSL